MRGIVDAAATDTGDALLQRFLASRGESAEACFADMPVPDATATSARPEGPAGPSVAQDGRVVLALDASGSMAARAGSRSKMEAAREAIGAFVDGLPGEVDVGLVAFGHRGSNRAADRAASCRAIEPLLPVSAGSRARVGAALAPIEPRGWTPLAAAIEAAGRQLDGGDGARAVYVVSDGQDTCDGDPVAAARALHEGGTRAVVNIIGFDLPAADRAQLKSVAEAGGGTFTEVSLTQELSDELRRQNRNFSEQLRASNRNSGTQLRNSNRTFAATLKLGNCVSSRNLRAGNQLRGWAREQGLDDAQLQALRRSFDAMQANQDARVARITAAAQQATQDANAGIQSVQDANERAARDAR